MDPFWLPPLTRIPTMSRGPRGVLLPPLAGSGRDGGVSRGELATFSGGEYAFEAQAEKMIEELYHGYKRFRKMEAGYFDVRAME